MLREMRIASLLAGGTALGERGHVFCWNDDEKPQMHPDLGNIVDLDGGDGWCAVAMDETVRCWGHYPTKQLVTIKFAQ